MHIRHKKYEELKNELKSIRHGADLEILLDAHDLCISEEPNLEFITSDANDINCIEKILEINKITDLRDYMDCQKSY